MDDSDSSDDAPSPRKRPPSPLSPPRNIVSPKRNLFRKGKEPLSPNYFNESFSSLLRPPRRGRSFDALRESSNSTDDLWPLICAKVLPLFNGEGLRQPIEDLNRLVSTHLVKINERREESHVLEDVTELFETGIKSLDNNLSTLNDERLISRLCEIWVFFFTSVLPYLEAAFLPISIAWGSNPSLYLPSSTESKSVQLSINNVALKCYRDILILPLHARLRKILSHLPMLLNIVSSPRLGSSVPDEISQSSFSLEYGSNDTSMRGEMFSRILQSISLLRRVNSGDQNQRDCDALGDAFLFRRAKGRGDRRGFVPAREAL